MKQFKPDNFVLAIIATVLLAYFFPQAARAGSGLPLDGISTIGVALIFFFYGVRLSGTKIRKGLGNWRLHLLVQAASFLLFPLVILAFYPLMAQGDFRQLWLSFLFLGALPSTVSSSVVMVAMARGNTTAAIFNASISGLIGILVTPLWMGLFLQAGDNDYSLAEIYLKLVTEILLPVILGMLLRRYLTKWVALYSRQLTVFDRAVILLIIYKSFARSFDEQLFSQLSAGVLILLMLVLPALFFIMYGLIGWAARRLHFNRADQITAQFCGTKKSLIHGTVFVKIVFPAGAAVGLTLLPLMIFHGLQIFIISILATKLAARQDTNQASEGS